MKDHTPATWIEHMEKLISKYKTSLDYPLLSDDGVEFIDLRHRSYGWATFRWKLDEDKVWFSFHPNHTKRTEKRIMTKHDGRVLWDVLIEEGYEILSQSTRMMEDAVVIYRISRAPERRIFYIDTGNLPKTKAESKEQGR